MNIKELREIINQEVRKAMQSELRDILVEAVEVVENSRVQKPVAARRQESCREQNEVKTFTGIGTLLQETAKEMTSDDYQNIMGGDKVSLEGGDFGIERSQQSNIVAESCGDALPSFVSRASQVLAAANEIDKQRHGV